MILGQIEITHILTEINSKSEVQRRKDELYNKSVYDGGLYDEVKSRLLQLFPKTGSLYTTSDYNLHKKIANKKSKAYIKPPKRKLDQESETDKYLEILSAFNFDDAMKLVDLYKNRHQYCGLGIIRNKKDVSDGTKKDVYSFWALAPYEFCVHRDSSDEIVAWSIPMGKQGDSDIWVIWTSRSHVKISTRDYKTFTLVPIDGNPNNVNPFGIIPFIYVPLDASGAYLKTSSLPRQAIELNANISIYLTAANMQIGQMVIKHSKKQEIDSVSTGLMTALKLPQEDGADKKPTEVSYITPSSDLTGQKEAIVTYMMMIFDEQGINGNSAVKSGETFSSGFDRLLANADVQDIIEDNQDLYSRVEQEAYKIIKSMNGRDNNYTFKSEKLSITYAKPKILSSDSEKLENLKKKKDLGLWEEWELLIEIDPNLTEEQAKDKVSKLKAENGNNQGRGVQGATTEPTAVA